MVKLCKSFFDGYCKTCKESSKLRKFTEAVFWIMGVTPHDADSRDPVDRLYFVMVWFNVLYMAGLVTAFIVGTEHEVLIDLFAYYLFLAYTTSILVYSRMNEKQKEIYAALNKRKKRAGHILAHTWGAIAIALTALVLVGQNEYNILLRTVWLMAIITNGAVLYVRLARNNNNNNSQGAK